MRYDVVIIGGGLAGLTAGVELLRAGRKCCVVSGGLSMHEGVPKKEFKDLGGVLLSGNRVTGGEWDGDTLKSVRTGSLEDTCIEADAFILATGKFFSRGLVATMEAVMEPLFNCDVEYDRDRSRWYDPDFFAPQPFESFGVKTDGCLVLRDGRRMKNLYAAGEVLAGRIDIIKSALDVCSRII